MNEIFGKTTGIKQTLLDSLLALYDEEISNREFCTTNLIQVLCHFTHVTGREAMVYVERGGEVLAVAVGENDRVTLPPIRSRRSQQRLCGIRCIHTHPGGNGRLSDVDLQSLLKLKLDAMSAVGVGGDGKPTQLYAGIIGEKCDDGHWGIDMMGPFSISRMPHSGLLAAIRAADARVRPEETIETKPERLRVITAGIDGPQGDYDPLEELAQLCDTAGFDVVHSMRQVRDKPERATYLGSGKVKELSLLVQAWDADFVIMDDELSPAQIRNLEKSLGGARIMDRTALILRIFSNRASTHEGRLQVDLATARYNLPRLTGFGVMMSRMGGGGGGGMGARRGGGEMEIELDRRMLRRRMYLLEQQIEQLSVQRRTHRTSRARNKVPVVALVGYTNAGKSTLLNSLSGAEVLAEDKLFATLDTTLRKVVTPAGEVLFVDTVGFIHKLPHDLVHAFRATLEEAAFADVLVHVVDATSPSRDQQMQVVNEVLQQLEVGQKPTITAYNKCDALPEPLHEGQTVSISAATGQGLDALLACISESLSDGRETLTVTLPHDKAALVSLAYAKGTVASVEYIDDGIQITATLPAAEANRLRVADIHYQPPEEETW